MSKLSRKEMEYSLYKKGYRVHIKQKTVYEAELKNINSKSITLYSGTYTSPKPAVEEIYNKVINNPEY